MINGIYGKVKQVLQICQ